jgi:AcrR family transcriptional regulator
VCAGPPGPGLPGSSRPLEIVADRPVGLYGSAVPHPSRTLSAPPQDSRDKILEIAEVHFAQGGFEGVGLRQLATAAGLSKSALFHHFSTKLELYEEVLCRVLERIEAGLESSKADSGDPIARLDAWVDSVVRTLAEDIPAARLLLRSLVEQQPLEGVVLEASGPREMMASEVRLARILGRFTSLIEEGVESGVFRPLSVVDAVQTIIGAVTFHFASGDLGEALIGESIFSASAVERRRKEVAEFIRRGLLA